MFQLGLPPFLSLVEVLKAIGKFPITKGEIGFLKENAGGAKTQGKRVFGRYLGQFSANRFAQAEAIGQRI